jgi:hypothetical protein
MTLREAIDHSASRLASHIDFSQRATKLIKEHGMAGEKYKDTHKVLLNTANLLDQYDGEAQKAKLAMAQLLDQHSEEIEVDSNGIVPLSRQA